VAELFEAQVVRTPGAIAVIDGDEQVTYREVDRRASNLAARLRHLGVGPEVRVGLYTDRSVAAIVGMLGILKAGGAYVPLDTDQPERRTAAVLSDAQVEIAVCQQTLAPRLAPLPVRTVRVEDEAHRRLEEGVSSSRVTEQNLAYIIYTSGSTGAPRGVMVEHRALANHTLAMCAQLGLERGDRFLQFAPLSFDASGTQIWPTLVSGATLVMHPSPGRLSNLELLRLCQSYQVSVLDLPGAFWQQWIADMRATTVKLGSPLRLFMTGGERVTREALDDWATQVQADAVFLSSYGPTEATDRLPRRGLYWRTWSGAGLRWPSWLDCRALRAAPIHVSAWRTPVPHW
jgi:non-ribosomal peptide synthetase component F